MKRSTVCLNMIVKDEAHVIRRCLDSVRPLIDSWAIVDTGSSDGTQQLIRDIMADVPGELFERPWRDFGSNRTEAIDLARGRADYLLFIDADDYAKVPPGFHLPPLTEDAYEIGIDYAGIFYRRLALVRSVLPWKYVGVLHEYIECDQPYTRKPLDGFRLQIGGEGGRSQQAEAEKYARDAALLERALQQEPGNARYAFYLAQSYRDCGQLEKSLEAYRRRAGMSGFVEETFCALLESARLQRRLGRPPQEVADGFLRAYEYRPLRAEPLGELARYYREQGQRWPLAHLFAARAMEIPRPADILFLEPAWYDWICQDEYAIAAYWIGEYEPCRKVCERLLRSDKTPPEQKPRILGNLNFAREKLGLAPLKNWPGAG
ncbi:MAG: glycosyltransferase [Nevskia sp.]|nr:glycosyltransferase [Nevskia sp.]